MAQTKSRIVGSNFTTFTYNGQPIAWLTSVQDSGQKSQSVTTGFQVITPLGYSRPQDIATSRVLAPGTLTAKVRELWTAPAWQQLQGLAGTINIITVWQTLSQTGSVVCTMAIKPPGSTTYRGWTYATCTVVGISDSETVTIGALTMTRNISIVYFLRTPLNSTGPAIF
jgi:hypothetical protein